MVKIETVNQEDHHLIQVMGEIDASSSIELDNALKTAGDTYKRILIDLTGLEYISSAGLGVFISYLEDWKKNNIRMVLFGMQEKVSEVFEILGLQHLLKITASKQEALEVLNEA